MVTGIVIPHEKVFALQKVEFEDLVDYQTAIGGFIEMVEMDGHALMIVADEDGKAKGLPINHRATYLWWLLHPNDLGADFWVGDVAILGVQRPGVVKDVPAGLQTLLLESHRFQVRVCLSHEHAEWIPLGGGYSDFFVAAMRAIDLMGVWVPPSDVKVVAVD